VRRDDEPPRARTITTRTSLQPTFVSPRGPSRAKVFALYALAALGMALWAAPRTSVNPRALLPAMVAGTAHRPYVYRALVPLVVRGLDGTLPAEARSAADSVVARSAFLSRSLRWEPAYGTWYALVFLLHWISLVVFGYAVRRLIHASYDAPPASEVAGGAAAIVLVAIHFGYQNFVYDFPQLALFSLAVAAVAQRRWAVYYAAFALGTINKETTVLLAAIFAATQWRRYSSRALAVHLASQLAIAAAVLLALHAAYHGNPGTPLEFHLDHNLHYVPRTRQIVHDVIYWGFWIVALWSWRRQKSLAAAALVVGAVLVGTTLFFGYLGEYRDYYEVFPLLCVLAFGTLTRAPARTAPAIA
jgi:hypothetical protein